MTSLYTNKISSSLHLLKDSVVWDSSATCHICNNLDCTITLLESLKEKILISTTSEDELIMKTTNIVIKYQINGQIEKVMIKNVYFALTVIITIISERLL